MATEQVDVQFSQSNDPQRLSPYGHHNRQTEHRRSACTNSHLLGCRVLTTTIRLKAHIPSWSSNTSWFKLTAKNCVRHEFRMQQLLECHINTWRFPERRTGLHFTLLLGSRARKTSCRSSVSCVFLFFLFLQFLCEKLTHVPHCYAYIIFSRYIYQVYYIYIALDYSLVVMVLHNFLKIYQ